MKIEFDHPTRSKNYQLANDEFPLARRREIAQMLHSVNARPGERILDFGCGTGVLTTHLQRAVGAHGTVYAFDNSHGPIAALKSHLSQRNVVSAVLAVERLPLPDNSVDAIASLANFHHVKDKAGVFQEFSRVLKKDGRLIIGDVADETPVQRFFDGPVDWFCSTGHKHPFVNPALAWNLCSDAGLEFASWDLANVPWEFRSEAEAGRFIQLLFDAQCSAEICIQQAKIFLGSQFNDHFFLPWQLFFMVARKDATVPKYAALEPATPEFASNF